MRDRGLLVDAHLLFHVDHDFSSAHAVAPVLHASRLIKWKGFGSARFPQSDGRMKGGVQRLERYSPKAGSC